MPGSQVFHSATQALVFCLRHLPRVYLCHSCGPAQGSWGFIQDFVEINLGKKVSYCAVTELPVTGKCHGPACSATQWARHGHCWCSSEMPQGKHLSLPCFSEGLLMQSITVPKKLNPLGKRGQVCT